MSGILTFCAGGAATMMLVELGARRYSEAIGSAILTAALLTAAALA